VPPTYQRDDLLTWLVDLEDVGQQLIEDNIVSVSRQMIDKEASVAQSSADAKAAPEESMEVDDPEEEL
jgi:hypothetical protein